MSVEPKDIHEVLSKIKNGGSDFILLDISGLVRSKSAHAIRSLFEEFSSRGFNIEVIGCDKILITKKKEEKNIFKIKDDCIFSKKVKEETLSLKEKIAKSQPWRKSEQIKNKNRFK